MQVILVSLVAAATAAPQNYRAPGSISGGRGAAAGVGGAFQQSASGFNQGSSRPFNSGP